MFIKLFLNQKKPILFVKESTFNISLILEIGHRILTTTKIEFLVPITMRVRITRLIVGMLISMTMIVFLITIIIGTDD